MRPSLQPYHGQLELINTREFSLQNRAKIHARKVPEMTQKSPVQTVRMGLIKASIWRNDTKAGVRHNVTVVRLFRNGDVWQESARFGRDDLPLVSKVMDMAHDWIYFHGDHGDGGQRGD
jgi:hypothetical protein